VQQHPGKVLLISGLDNDLFWRAWYSEPFRALGVRQIYLMQNTSRRIQRVRTDAAIAPHFLADTIAVSILERKLARVYEVLPDGRLRDATGLTLATLQRRRLIGPQFLDARSSLSSVHLGAGWWPPETNHRWMSAAATVELRGPEKRPGELVLRGFCAPAHLRDGPVHLSVSVDGIALPPARIDQQNLHFELHLPLPASVTAKPLMKVDMAIDRPLFVPSDGRHFGAAFGTFEVRP
jgi:hypothetical protein